MNVWLIQIGETLPVRPEIRKLRTAYIADELNRRGHSVIWWASAFDHLKKKWVCNDQTEVKPNDQFVLKLLKGFGYKKNISISRFIDHRILAKKFAKNVTSMPPLRTMPTISLAQYLYYVLIKGIRQIPFLNYIQYNQNDSKKILKEEIGWRDYGGKHYESVWTRFFQGYYLPTKFDFDKRKAHLSTLICSGQITRDEALAEMEKSIYPSDLLREDMQFVKKKLGLTDEEFEAILHIPRKQHTEYPTHYFLFHKLQKYKNIFRRIATSS